DKEAKDQLNEIADELKKAYKEEKIGDVLKEAISSYGEPNDDDDKDEDKNEDRDDKKSESRDSKDDDKDNNRGGNSLSHRNDIFNSRVKSWIISAGTIGEVTAVSAGSLVLKTTTGEIYTVTTTDATVRHSDDKSSTAILVGNTVYVFGIKNANTIVASMVIVGKTKDDVKPNTEEKRQAYFGVVTAKSDTTLTILSANNLSYTVSLAADAQIWINKNKQSNLSGFVVGDNVVVQGTLSGTNLSAKKLVAMHLPVGTIIGKITASSGTTLTVLGTDNKTYTVLTTDASIKAKGKDGTLAVGDSVIAKGDITGTTLTAKTVSEEKLKGGFFNRFGLFFKSIFGKK
ncbi:MAG: DUF5666 domain-containing protein, partial [Patescibacteria group bacterium]